MKCVWALIAGVFLLNVIFTITVVMLFTGNPSNVKLIETEDLSLTLDEVPEHGNSAHWKDFNTFVHYLQKYCINTTSCFSLPDIISYGDPGLVKVLLYNGAEPNKEDGQGFRALHRAIEKNNLEIVKLLANYSANLTAQIKNEYGDTPLHTAVIHNYVAIAKWLLDQGIIPVDIRNKKGVTPLHSASWCGNIQSVELLLDRGANINLTITDPYTGSGTPLHEAAKTGHAETTELLLKRGAYINALTIDKKTPLHLAAQEGQFGTAQLLVQNGADIMVHNKDGRTPSELAFSKGHISLGKFLSPKKNENV